jgi:hypothetical protein
MGSAPSRWLARGAALLLMAAAGCETFGFDGFGSELGCSVASVAQIGQAIGAAFGAAQSRALSDDSGALVPGVEGTCLADLCDLRLAQVGTRIEVRVDLTFLAARRGISLDDAPALPLFESTDAEIISVVNDSAERDPCSDHWVVNAGVKFAKPGQAALRVRHGASELARFSFEVEQATSLEVSALPGTAPDSLEIVGNEQGTRSVRGGLNAGMSLRVRARNGDGRSMLLDNSVRSTIDDASVARFVRSTQPASAHGIKLYVVFLKEGSTTLRTVSGDVTSLVELHGDPALPSPPPLPAAGSSARE